MKAFIFVTSEGYTYQPLSEAIEPDIENLQVLGFANGESAESAFAQLLTENSWLAETAFREVVCLELAHVDFEKRSQVFLLPSKAGD